MDRTAITNDELSAVSQKKVLQDFSEEFTPTYPAGCSCENHPPISTFPAFCRWNVDIANEVTLFSGQSDILQPIPDGCPWFGHVETNNRDKLYKNTNCFSFLIEDENITIEFFDNEKFYLGRFVSSEGSGKKQEGEGKGSWE